MSTAAIRTVAILAIFAALLAGYIAGYFWMGTFWDGRVHISLPCIVRSYPHEWQAKIFKPAAKVETWLSGVDTNITCDSYCPANQ